MIIRILGEGQFDVADSLVDQLNVLDGEVEAAIAANDSAAFGSAMAGLVGFVLGNGSRLPDDDLRPSDALLPPDDSTIEEARGLLQDDGLIPG